MLQKYGVQARCLGFGEMFAGKLECARKQGVLDADTVVAGMRPAVAITLVELGLWLGGVRTALDTERGLRMLADGERRAVVLAQVPDPEVDVEPSVW